MEDRMKLVPRLAIALALGLLAAGLNWLAIRPRGARYVAVASAIAPGAPFDERTLKPLSLADSSPDLRTSFVPWNDRAVLLAMAAPRAFAAGDVVLQRDVREAIRLAERDLELLRFRVIAVGDDFKRASAPESPATRGGNESTVTIAVKQPPDDHAGPDDKAQRDARRMVRVVTRRASRSAPLPEDAIYGVAVFPRAASDPEKANSAAESKIAQPLDDEMALTVSLDGVESVPAVILVGGEIGFFMLPELP
jgi:hypothetical protein